MLTPTEMGRQHGRAAASWLFDGNTTLDTYKKFRKGMEEGDPLYLDQLPTADLSGQNADTYSMADLRRDFPLEDPNEAASEYEEGYEEAVTAEVERVLAYHLDGA